MSEENNSVETIYGSCRQKIIDIKARKVKIHEETGIPTIVVDNYFDLVTDIGQIKFHFAQDNMKILMRGQTSDYNFSLKPAILRNLPSLRNNLSELDFVLKTGQGLINHIYRELEANEVKILDNKIILQATLQHYGLYTQWLDLTDNPTVAFYFAMQDLLQGTLNEQSSINGYLYLLVFKEHEKKQRGWYENEVQYLIDLREASSSDVLRAHTQQAWVIAAKKLFDIEEIITHPNLIDFDYNRYCILRIEFNKKQIVSHIWLNKCKPVFFSKEGFFPNIPDKVYKYSMSKFIEILKYLAEQDSSTKEMKFRAFPDTLAEYLHNVKNELYKYFFSNFQICEIIKFAEKRFSFNRDEDRRMMIQAYKKHVCVSE